MSFHFVSFHFDARLVCRLRERHNSGNAMVASEPQPFAQCQRVVGYVSRLSEDGQFMANRRLLISEALTPLEGTGDTRRMGLGEPGLPAGFEWRGNGHAIRELVAAWKQSDREGGSGQRYLRRHYYRLRMDDGATWTVYFTRQSAKRGSRVPRWFLYTIERFADRAHDAGSPDP